jgi:hypothetical protein
MRHWTVNPFHVVSTLLLGGLVVGCGAAPSVVPPLEPDAALRINEVVSNNQGVWVDEYGETDDYVELHNPSANTLELSDYSLVDSGKIFPLPAMRVRPGQTQLLWADGTPEQGALHLGFKVSSSGERLQLVWSSPGALADQAEVVDDVLVPALAEHHAYLRIPDGKGAFTDCGWATPGRPNGAACGPPEPPKPTDSPFAPFTWPSPWPPVAAPLAISEARLEHTGGTVEVQNTTDQPLDLAAYALRISAHGPGLPWPSADAGVALPLSAQTLKPGERLSLPVTETELVEVAAAPGHEGVITLFRNEDGQSVDRIDFTARPEPGVGDRFRGVLSEENFHALAAGRTALGVESVEFVIDLASGDVVTFLNSASWDLHYTFIREMIQNQPHLDRCDPTERAEHYLGWVAFSQEEYFKVEGRHYLLGTLVRHAGTGLSTVEFAQGDEISAEQMKHAFLTVMKHVEEPKKWQIRPQNPAQVARVRMIEGEAPLVATEAPFEGVSFQPLAPGVAVGTLRVVTGDELRTLELGPRDIVLTDQVPNDIPLLGALITESFQTPLAHVNVLSRGRGTPNMALRDARSDPRVAPFIGKLVRLEVTGSEFTLAQVAAEEALAFWESRKPSSMPLVPRVDTSQRGVLPLELTSLFDIPAIGGKAAQFSELMRVPFCAGPVTVPQQAFAIPVVHSIEHFAASGARARLSELSQDPEFLADPARRAAGLGEVRAAILAYPLDPTLHDELVQAINARWSGRPLRFRSSSNVEDLAGFNGAGLYSSLGLEPDEVDAHLDDAVRAVWASLWNERAFAERAYYSVDQSQVAMAVLVHPGFHSEHVNGVAISRDILEPMHGDRFYVNAQIGEALVTNPAPGVASDEFTYDPGRVQLVYHEHSSLSPDVRVMSPSEAAFLACNLNAIHQYFQPLLDPAQKNPWFAMDIEFKLIGPERVLLIKQARSYSFGQEAPTGNSCSF